jgi:hypothetical protein
MDSPPNSLPNIDAMGGQKPGVRSLKTVANFEEATLLKRENVAKFIQYLSPFSWRGRKASL